MSQLQLMEPQFECGIFEIWSVGIIDSLIYRANCGLDDLPYDVDANLSFEQRLEKCEKSLDLLDLRSMKPELYEILLSKTGYLVRKICSDICDPCDKLIFKSRFIDLIFLNFLREKQLLTELAEYYYESVVDIFSRVNFGLAFIIDVMADQGWYKYESKFLTRFTDEDQVRLITTGLSNLSSDFHLNVLFVIWNIERALNHDEDTSALHEFKVSSDHLLSQTTVKTFDFRDNLAIYLSLINVTLEEFVVTVSRKATRMLGLDKKYETEDPVNPILLKVKVTLTSIESITSFINDLGEKLFPDQQLADIENLKNCLKDQKSEAIVEMIASIIELNSFLEILEQEISFTKVTFQGFDVIMNGLDEWSQVVNFGEIMCQEVLSMKRFFTKEREESRYLTCLIIKYELPKYFDILETIDLELYLDPFVIFTFCDILKDTTDREENNHDLLEDMIVLLKRVLTNIKSKKRITSLFKARAYFFGLYSLGNVKNAQLSQILRQKSGAVRYDHVRDEILLASFLSPYEILDFIVADTLEHSHHMIPFLSKLFIMELNNFMNSSCETRFNNSLFEVILACRLTSYPTESTVSGLLKLIKETFLFQQNSKKPIHQPILFLDRLFCLLAWESCMDATIIAHQKISIYKLIQSLTDEFNIPWPLVAAEPCSLLYSLINMIDFFYVNGSVKAIFVELIAFVMNKKVQRKLTNKEFFWIKRKMEYYEESLMLTAYLEPWLEDRFSFYFDINQFPETQTYVIASILKDNAWINLKTKYSLDHYVNGLFGKNLSAILPFLTRSEFDNLFLFLCYQTPLDIAMMDICDAYSKIDVTHKVNIDYMTKSLTECLYSHYLAYLKDPAKYDLKARSFRYGRCKRLPLDKLLYIFYRRVSICLNLKKRDRSNPILDNFLHKLAEEMNTDDVNELIYKSKIGLHCIAERILRAHHKEVTSMPILIQPKYIPG